MIQLNINKLPETLKLVVFLESEVRIIGMLKTITESGQLPELVNPFPDSIPADSTPVTGTTTSKLIYIKRSFTPGDEYLNKETIIRGTNIKAMIIRDDDKESHYSLYRGTGYQIDYVDANRVTTFTCIPDPTAHKFVNPTFMLAYQDIIDEPKLDSNLFINRGVNNVFESFKRIKTSTNMQELKKTGFGFFKFYDAGIN